MAVAAAAEANDAQNNDRRISVAVGGNVQIFQGEVRIPNAGRDGENLPSVKLWELAHFMSAMAGVCCARTTCAPILAGISMVIGGKFACMPNRHLPIGVKFIGLGMSFLSGMTGWINWHEFIVAYFAARVVCSFMEYTCWTMGRLLGHE